MRSIEQKKNEIVFFNIGITNWHVIGRVSFSTGNIFIHQQRSTESIAFKEIWMIKLYCG